MAELAEPAGIAVGATTVVVGSSIAGVRAAQALRAEGFAGPVTLVAREDELPYERPPLSKTLIGSSAAALKPIVDGQTYLDRDIETRLGVRVSGLDVAGGACRRHALSL